MRIDIMTTVEELKSIEDEINIDATIKKIVSTFLVAINDWPTDISTIENYELAVHSFIKGVTTEANIKKAEKTISVANNAWQFESLSQILEVFNYYKQGTSLKQIVDDVRAKLLR